MAQTPVNADPASPGFWTSDAPQLMWNARLPPPPDEAGLRAAIPRGHAVFSTSGSSGPPKLICLSREALLASAALVSSRLHVTAEDIWLRALPLFHVGGVGIHARSRLTGCRVVADTLKWDAARVVRLMEEEGVTIASAVPTQVHDLVCAGLRAPQSLRVLLTGGAALSPDLERQALALGWPVHATYGLTEAASSVAISTIPGGPMEMLLPRHARITRRRTLELSGPMLFSGSMRHEDDAWHFIPRSGEWYETSDLATLNGVVLGIHGRADRTVKIRGELVNLDHLESLLPPDCVLAARPDARAGHELILITESTADEAALTAACHAFPPFARVAAVHRIPELPRTALGKPDRTALQALADRFTSPS